MDTITIKDWTLLLIGLALGGFVGFAASWSAGYLTLFDQFKRGAAWRRVNYVADVTGAFSKPHQITGALGSEYRYSMGTIIDNLSHKRDQEIPLLADRNKDNPPTFRGDGWTRFNAYIKPVFDVIAPYSFPAPFRWVKSEARQHYALMRLCNAMELVVMKLDGGFENPQIVWWEHIEGGDESAYELKIRDISGQEDRITSLKSALAELEQRWIQWKKVCGISNNKNPGS